MIKSFKLQKYVGKQVRRFRRQANMPQEQLAEMDGIAVIFLSSIEMGNSFMTITTLDGLLNSLKIMPRDLFYFTEINNTETDMYEYIKDKLKSIEQEKEKLSMLYNFIKLLV